MSERDENDVTNSIQNSIPTDNDQPTPAKRNKDHVKNNGMPTNGDAPEMDTKSTVEQNASQIESKTSVPEPSVKANSPSNWVQFENDEGESNKPMESKSKNETPSPSSQPPVLATESVHINIKNLPSTNQSSSSSSSVPHVQKPTSFSSPAVIEIPTNNVTTSFSTSTPNEQGLRTIELSTGRVREGFANGDVIVTLLPINTRWPWIVPPVFRPELVPEELMAQGLTLTVEEYVHAMETLVNDFRFTLYNVCYKRVLLVWVVFAFAVLLGLLFSGLKGIALFSLGVAWLFLNAAAIFMCMWIKLRLARGLERCLASVNKQLIRHKIILALDDRGRISCHKVNLCFMYYDPEQCVNYLNEFIERSEQNGTTIQAGWESRLDVDVNDIVIQGSSTTRVSRKKERGILLFLRYASRWANEVVRGLSHVGVTEPARHCVSYTCPCQYIERHLKCKPQGVLCGCCLTLSDPIYQYQY